jgi:hypothetical protein
MTCNYTPFFYIIPLTDSTAYLKTSTTVTVSRPLPLAVTQASALSILHDYKAIISLNPLVKSYIILSSSAPFYKSVPADLKPSSATDLEKISVYSVIESSAPAEEGTGATWRGGWTKAFVPSELSYENSYQHMEQGGMILTHAPMGVNSVTRWTIEGAEGAWTVKLELKVNSNRMLMGLIKTTLQPSVEKLIDDFVKAVGKFQETGKLVLLEGDGKRVEVS